MAKAKKDAQKKVKAVKALKGLSKEMKADVEKILEKSQKQAHKRFLAIENQVEKLKGGAPKAKTKKAGKKAKPAKAAKAKPTKAKKKGAMKKKAQPQAQEAE